MDADKRGSSNVCNLRLSASIRGRLFCLVIAEIGGDHFSGEEFRVGGEVDGGDFGELLFD